MLYYYKLMKGVILMKKNHRILAILLSVALLAAAAGCQKEVTAEDLMTNISVENASESSLDDSFCQIYSGTSFKILKNVYSSNGGNVIISPLAAYYNASLIANGSNANDKARIEKAFGNNFSTDQLNVFLHSYCERQLNTDFAKLYFVNGIWFNSDKNATPFSDFLSIAKTYYDAAAYKDSFSKDAVTNINNWMSNKTDLFVEKPVNEISSDAPACLVNATTMDANWEAQIPLENVLPGKFTNISGVEEDVKMMSCYEYIYIGDDNVKGFMKNYAGGKYAFLALLPSQNTSSAVINLLDYLSQGSTYRHLIKRKGRRTIDASIPRFSCDFIGGMKPVFEGLDVGTCFNSKYADLDNMATSDDRFYLDDLYTYTSLSLTEKGTGKGTGGTVTNSAVGASVTPVNLNRPFVFAVVDTQYYIPIMVGAVNTING